jgi:multiple sugar transport system permease protein
VSNRARLSSYSLNVGTILILIVFLFPIYWMFVSSFKTSSEIFAKVPTFYPHLPTLEGYKQQIFLSTVPLWRPFVNSSIIAAGTMVVSTVFSIFSAYGLARFNLRVNRYVLLAFLVTQMLPAVLFLAPLFMVYKALRVLNTLICPVIFVCLHGIPFCVLVLRPYFLGIPKELEDAATIDGCNQFSAFLRIMLPISYPGVIVAATFTFLWGWGDLMGALTFLQKDVLQPLTVNMYTAISQYGIEWNGLMAFAVIITVPVLIIFIALQRFLVSGLSSGAIKG